MLAWGVSNTLDAAPCIAALAHYGPPEILNTDQGAQYTSEAFISVLQSQNMHISMDGKGRWVDKVFVERVWRSVKYEDIYLRAYESPAALRKGFRQYFQFYHAQRQHQTLNRQTPDAVWGYEGEDGGIMTSQNFTYRAVQKIGDHFLCQLTEALSGSDEEKQRIST